MTAIIILMGKKLVQKKLDPYLEEAEKQLRRNPKHYDEIVEKIQKGIGSNPSLPLPQIQEVIESCFRGMPLTMRMVTYPKRDEYVGYDQRTDTTVLCSCWDTSLPMQYDGSGGVNKITVWFTAREGDVSGLKNDKIEQNPGKGFFYHVIKDVKY